MNKVVVIGLQRTGTTSLGQVLLMLGYDVVATAPKLADYLVVGNKEKVLEFADQFDAYQDLPWIFLYKELDKKYPNTKFIFTKRDEQSWIKSMVNHFGNTDTEMRKWAYGVGCPKKNEKKYIDVYRIHNKEVTKYFEGREKDLLVVELGRDQNWQRLCAFLEKPVPKKKFPFENKNPKNYTFIERLYSSLRAIIPKVIRRKILILFGFKKRLDRFNTKK
jgi:hypothetical protein